MIAPSSIVDAGIRTAKALRLYAAWEDARRAAARGKRTTVRVGARLDNFNPDRLRSTSAATAYPRHDRPRGQDDLRSVAFHRRAIRQGRALPPIVVHRRGRRRTLLDGAHRLVAAHLEGVSTVPAIELL